MFAVPELHFSLSLSLSLSLSFFLFVVIFLCLSCFVMLLLLLLFSRPVREWRSSGVGRGNAGAMGRCCSSVSRLTGRHRERGPMAAARNSFIGFY